MSSAVQNRHIARLIVGAMSIDGFLSKEEQKKVAKTLQHLHMAELIADVGAALEADDGDFNMYEECKALLDSLGNDAEELAPMIFRTIASVIASDRFVSAQEASYLSGMARRLKLSPEQARNTFKEVMAECRGRLEISAHDVDEFIHPHLKELLSFSGADELVGELAEDSLEELLHRAQQTMNEGCDYSVKDVERALAVLGLDRTANLDEAEEVWKETISNLNLPKLAGLGETFVTAALNRITEINDAYKTILHFHEHLQKSRKAKTEAQQLEKKIERSKEPSSRNDLAGSLEEELTGVGVAGRDD